MYNFDLVIVGAGSAGCIVANNIINTTNYRVLLIEAGPSDNNPAIQVPLGYGMTFYHNTMNWNFYSKSQTELNNREIYYPRGKVIGGSGSINAMIYARGLKSDYENWNLNSNWSWENIQSTFNELEYAVNEEKNQFIEIPNSKKIWDCDLVILALGFTGPEKKLPKELDVMLDKKGNISANSNYQTKKNNIFTAGDCRRGQSLIVWAISEGREASYHLDKYLMGSSNLPRKNTFGDL